MIHTIKNIKWIITTCITCIVLGVITFFAFINQSFIKLSEINLQILLILDVVFLAVFFYLILQKTLSAFKEGKKVKLGSKTTFRYIAFFSLTTLLPSILIAVFSLILFNVSLQKYFDGKIKSIVNNSTEIAQNYVIEKRNSIEADILLVYLDINNKFSLFYNNPKKFQGTLTSQRLLRRLDEIHLLDSASNIIMSNINDPSLEFVAPPEEAFDKTLNGRPVRITDPVTNRTSSLVKLDNYIDTYLYIVKFLDPKVISYLKQTEQAVNFYYVVQDQKTQIKITFVIIYILIVTLLLFLAVIVSINLASRLTRPIVNLIGASEKISRGDLDAKVPKINTDKEFEKLNENFNLMIEKLKEQQNKLILSERHAAWESVARKLAHEIKNPLTPIQLSIDRLKEKYLSKIGADSKNFSTYLDTINKQIKDIEHLVNEFSDFARMPKPTFKKIDLIKVILRAVKLNELSEPKIKFLLTEINFPKHISGDEEQLNRVFINLIKNSIESIHEKNVENVDFKGKISIEIKDDSDYIYVTIEDNGVGLSQVDKEKMLAPYFTTKSDGTGLGLAVVSKIISDHNSLILFESAKQGARAKVTFPKIV